MSDDPSQPDLQQQQAATDGDAMAMSDTGVGGPTDDEDQLTKNDAWHVITSYFDEKGLVRQQLDSFDEFIQNKMQEVVDEQLPVEIYPEPQVPEDHPDYVRKKFRYKFGQVYLSTPQLTEKDGTTDTMRPMVARIRNLTYNAPLFVDISERESIIDADGNETEVLKDKSERMFLGKVPIMLQSTSHTRASEGGGSTTSRADRCSPDLPLPVAISLLARHVLRAQIAAQQGTDGHGRVSVKGDETCEMDDLVRACVCSPCFLPCLPPSLPQALTIRAVTS